MANKYKTFAVQAVPGRFLSEKEIQAAHKKLEELSQQHRRTKGEVVVALIMAAEVENNAAFSSN